MVTSFLTSLAGGMLTSLAACRLQLVAWNFVRLIGIVAFVLSACAMILQLRPQAGAPRAAWWALGPTVLAVASAFAVMVIAPLVERQARLARRLCAFGGAAGMAAGCAWAVAVGGASGIEHGGKSAMILGGQLCGALLLGTVTVAWMLGHAYLTATGMTIAPLRTLSRLLVAAVALRAVYVAACLAGLFIVADGATTLAQVWADSWPAVSLRLGAGLVLLGIFAYMVLDCVRLRSTQSATGILYFASLLAYVGELSSQHLVSRWGWPL